MPSHAVAVIGLSGRFPGAASPRALWQNLAGGVESIATLSDEQLTQAGVSRELLRHPHYVKAAPAFAGVDLFDAPFFAISPAEAELMDPQHRLFLECAWHSLEDAGYGGTTMQRVGVYGGAGLNRYAMQVFEPAELQQPSAGVKAVTGNDKDYLTARVSYKCGLRGPSVCVQTACSTSLVAVHVACRSLLDEEVDMALAGGVSLRVPAGLGYLHEEGGILSPDGHCRAFDADAAGTIFGSGVGIVVLKRLADALADGDHIRAVILGSAVNNDGAMKAGFTAPGVDSQASVIAEAIAMAGVDARSLTCVEAHGTGTALGDPVEIRALTRAFQGWTADRGFCAIGSVKTNVGHLDVAAGVTGLIKSILALEHQQIPASLHFRRPNPEIDFENSPFRVNTVLRDWPASGHPRRAGVSSFGLGGTNCHLILEEAPEPARRGLPQRSRHLVLLSAKSEAALNQTCDELSHHVIRTPDLRLDDIAFTSQLGRAELPHRRVVVADSGSRLVAALRETRTPSVVSSTASSSGPPVALLFPGQGSQFPGMGAGLYETEPTFRQEIDLGSAIVQCEFGFDLRACMLPAAPGAPAPDLQDTRVLQPTLFVLELALARLWLSWGLRISAAIGHSVGEYAAASLAGVMSFEDAVRLMAYRGALMAEQPRGMMLAVCLSESQIRTWLSAELSIAAINRRDQTVVSGPSDAILGLESTLASHRVASYRLGTSHAFHSAMMDPVLDRFRAAVARVQLSPPQIPYVSNRTGTWITAEEATSPEYWTRHLREPVRFEDGARAIAAIPEVVMLESGPGTVLGRMVKGLSGASPRCLASLPGPQTPEEAETHLCQTLGELWLAGVPVQWTRVQTGRGCRRVPLPGYPFQRERYWRKRSVTLRRAEGDGAEVARPRVFVPIWRQTAVAPAPDASQAAARLRVIVHDGDPAARQIADRIAESGTEAITVVPASAFERLGATSYAMDVDRPEHHAALAAELGRHDYDELDIVYLLTFSPCGDGDNDRRRTSSFYSLLWMAQALGMQLPDRRVTMMIVSTNAQAVSGRETVCADKALLAGPFHVIPREYPNIRCRWIDADRPSHPEEIPRLASFLDVLMRSGVRHRTPYAWRGGRCFELRHAEVSLRPAGPDGTPFEPQGVYLITGGFGGIGLAAARMLAREYHARLVLIGRTELPDRREWVRVSHAAAGEAIVRRVEAVRELERAGGTVLPLSADVADAQQMRAAIHAAKAAFGRISGVIHAAGLPGGGLIAAKTREAAERVLRVKVDGTRVLWDLLASEPLDFFACCSSLQSVLGSYGQSDYCAANAFLNAFAEQEHRSGRRCLSIAWDTWRNVGMAAGIAAPPAGGDDPEHGSSSGIECDDGITILAPLLSMAVPQCAVSAIDLDTRLDAPAQPDRHYPCVTTGPTPAGAAHERPDLFTPYVQPETELERTIASVWEQVLGIDRVGVDDSLFELGGDSVGAIRVADQLQARLGVALPPVRLFSASTVRQLAQLIEGENTGPELAARRERGQRRRIAPRGNRGHSDDRLPIGDAEGAAREGA